jgi:threonine aldolase
MAASARARSGAVRRQRHHEQPGGDHGALRPGDEAIVGSESHILHYEAPERPASRRAARRTDDPRGGIDPADVAATFARERASSTRCCIENTHNRCGGRDPAGGHRSARGRGAGTACACTSMGAHLQRGARPERARLVAPADSIGFCLSKGLGAPVGSVLCGSGDFIARARKMRKMVGGGMRQAGIIAAAGVYALEHMVDRLADDHANAKLLARGLAELPMVDLDPETIDTNIVIFRVDGDALGFARSMKRAGVLSTMPGPGRIRMVTHYGIERGDVEDALARVRHAAAALA